jgi:hypothetical protein
VSEIDAFGLSNFQFHSVFGSSHGQLLSLSGRALALVGAGSVVTKSVPPRSVVVGNPARVIRTLPIKKEGEETEAEKRRKMLGL